MKQFQKPDETKQWKDYTAKEKKETVAVFGTISVFVLIWLSSGFLSAVGMTIVLWSLYLGYLVIKNKDFRSKTAAGALVLFVLGGLILPSEQPSSNLSNVDTKNTVNDTIKVDTAEAERIETAARIKDEQETKQKKEKADLAQEWQQSGDLYDVVGITDGDTIKVSINGKTETIRFIGMDTPETKHPSKPVQCYGKEASSRMQHFAQSQKVRLTDDSTQGDKDKYGRLLRYVFNENGKNIAYEMIRGGYAHEYTYSKPYKYHTQFKAAEKLAIKDKAGLWASNTCKGKTDQEYPKTAEPTPVATPKPVVRAAPKPAPKPAKKPSSNNSSVYYKNCTAARNAGAAPVYQGSPGYGAHLDRDRDGVGCE